MTHPAEQDVESPVDQAFAMQPLAHAGAVEHLDRALLEHAGADAAEDVLATAVFDDDGVDAGEVEQLPEQKAGRPRADDGDLYAHEDLTIRPSRGEL